MMLHTPGSNLNFEQDGKPIGGSLVGLVELSWWWLTSSRIQSSPLSSACEENEAPSTAFNNDEKLHPEQISCNSEAKSDE